MHGHVLERRSMLGYGRALRFNFGSSLWFLTAGPIVGGQQFFSFPKHDSAFQGHQYTATASSMANLIERGAFGSHIDAYTMSIESTSDNKPHVHVLMYSNWATPELSERLMTDSSDGEINRHYLEQYLDELACEKLVHVDIDSFLVDTFHRHTEKCRAKGCVYPKPSVEATRCKLELSAGRERQARLIVVNFQQPPALSSAN